MSLYSKRLEVLRLHLNHLRDLRPRITGTEVLYRDLSLYNDISLSLLRVCQTVIGTACELSARHELPFRDDVEAVRNLATDSGLPLEKVYVLEVLPAIRNALLGESQPLELERYAEILDCLGPVEEFLNIAQELDA